MKRIVTILTLTVLFALTMTDTASAIGCKGGLFHRNKGGSASCGLPSAVMVQTTQTRVTTTTQTQTVPTTTVQASGCSQSGAGGCSAGRVGLFRRR